MNKTYATAILVLWVSMTFGQHIIPEALTSTEKNEFGDPITNVVDMNGAQQGDWFYEDIYGHLFLKEHYVDHVLQETYFSVVYADGSVGWETSSSWVENDDLRVKLHQKIVDVHGALNADQQVTLFISSNGELVRFVPLGNMNTIQAQQIEQTVLEFLETNLIPVGDETVLFI